MHRHLASLLLSLSVTTAHAAAVPPPQAPDDLVVVVHFDTVKRTRERVDAVSSAYGRPFEAIPRVVRLQWDTSNDRTDVRIEFDPAVDPNAARTAVAAAIEDLGPTLRAETTKTVVRWQRGMLMDGSGPPRDLRVLNVVADSPGTSAEALRAAVTTRLAPRLEAFAGVRRVRCGARAERALCRIEPVGWIDDASTERAVRATLDDARRDLPFATTDVAWSAAPTEYLRVR